MKNILLIGIGGTGSEAVDILYKKIRELGQQNDNIINAIVLDTDTGDMSMIKDATVISMSDTGSVGTICDSIGRDYLKNWFPCNDPTVRTQEMIKGASQWRKKSYLAFLNAMNKQSSRRAFKNTLERMTIDPNASCEVYIIASIAGGTGSGSFIPIALYVRQYLRKQLGKNPMIYAMIALPDIFAEQQTRDNKIKVYANAYAILRELNAINLVSRDYNKGRTARKQSPIKFKIGHEDEPNVGLLFDASNPSFWTPEAAPFNQIFLLDKITNIESIRAHNMVLANSLYTLLCTEIGNKFDSEVSNHELLRSQNNGSNAIYAGISTSQINFPIDSILDYLAHEKTIASCEKEWLIIHRETEKKIQEQEENAKDTGRRYVMKETDYPRFFLDAFEQFELKENEELIVSIVKNDTVAHDEEGEVVDPIEEYIASIKKIVEDRTPSFDIQKVLEQSDFKNPNKPDAEEIQEFANSALEEITSYYKECVESIRKAARSLSESILSFNPETFALADKKIAVVENLLKKDERFIHPVSAVYQLCKLKIALSEIVEPLKLVAPWPEIKRGEVKDVYEPLLKVAIDDDKSLRKSLYNGAGDNRFADLCNDAVYEEKSKSNFRLDLMVLENDIQNIFSNIKAKALEQVNKIIFERLSKDVTLLLQKYRVFFNRFEKEKSELIEETKTVKKVNSANVGSIINVYSSEKEKEQILEQIFRANGPLTETEMAESNHIAGFGVFNTVYDAASAERNEKSWNDKDSSSYRSLFAKMIEAYKLSISQSEAYIALSECSVIEAMIKAAGPDAAFNDLEDKFRAYFQLAQEFAKPSLRISNRYDNGLVRPSNIIVFMMSYDTAKFIKKNADAFKINIPVDQGSEYAIVLSCAEEFVRRYAANDNVRVSVVKSMPSKVLYCTGEIMDITPLCIEKFDELSEDNLYYTNYKKALKHFKIYNTEMWNPHLGDNLHKRGYLPYMNPEMEKECDRRMIKALLYGLITGKITFDKGMALSKNYSFRVVRDGNREQIKSMEGQIVQEKNIAKLVSWIRNEEELIEDWSVAYDESIERQCAELPIMTADNEIDVLEGRITSLPFMRQLVGLREASRGVTDTYGILQLEPDQPKLSIIDFAYKIKNNEESSGDCDDAERILEVAYETFMKIMNYRTPKDVYPERFIQLYKHEIANVYGGVAEAAIKCTKDDLKKQNGRIIAINLFEAIVSWMNYAGTFKGIGEDKEAINEMGEIVINQVVGIKHDLCFRALKRIKEVTPNIQYEKLITADDYDDTEYEGEELFENEEVTGNEVVNQQQEEVNESLENGETPVEPNPVKKPVKKSTKKPAKKTTKK